jgi:hypothetical protein
MAGMRREKSVLFAIVFCCSSLPVVAQTLQVQPNEISAGESATLSWDTAGVEAFILGYGKKVSGKGSTKVKPAFSTDFTMVSETAHGIEYSTKHLSVTGAKGDDDYPSLKEFDDPIQGKRTAVDYIDFQSTVRVTLQDRGYTVKGDYVPKRPYITAYTNFVLRGDLISKEERIRARRLAIAIEIYEPKNGEINFGVRPRLEFQYRGEDEWRPDKQNSALAKAEATRVVQSLGSVK